jgi:Acyl-protein synthetase, LuxE
MTNQSAPNLSAFVARMREFIQRTSAQGAKSRTPEQELEFDGMALGLFEIQYRSNVNYRQFCEARKATLESVQNWREIPAMPTAAFKELELTSIPTQERTAVFYSSGTTEQRPSRHFHHADSLAVYEASLIGWFAAQIQAAIFPAGPNVLPLPKGEGRGEGEGDKIPPVPAGSQSIFFLTPSAAQSPNSSLVHMFETIRREFGSPDSVFMGRVRSDGAWEVDLDNTVSVLRAGIAEERAISLFGTAFGFVHLVDHLAETGTQLRLPPGSSVLETGGYKGRSRALPKAELHGLIGEWLGISGEQIVCEYGMSELSSQAYDGFGQRIFRFPPWARVQIISPETGREVAEGETGLIRVFDLANVYSVMAIQTEDLGVRRGDGFELIGRAAMAEPRGCSLASI